MDPLPKLKRVSSSPVSISSGNKYPFSSPRNDDLDLQRQVNYLSSELG